jgi:hypothetical protein
MMLPTQRVLDQLVADEPCLGAVFCTYSFDPVFFEEHVVRALLRIQADPVEDAARFHQEARLALQQTPVAAIVAASERQPGRRLPYDLLQVSELVFHPKSVLLLYREHARLMIGSGNLTFGGYSGNTELFVVFDLQYDVPRDVGVLASYDQHLQRVTSVLQQPGTLLLQVRTALQRRLRPTGVSSSFALLDSFEAPIMDQVIACLPASATIEHIGFLAPFFERDDRGGLDESSVLGALLHRASSNVTIDVGVAWENSQVAPDSSPSTLSEGLGQLWAWSRGKGDLRTIEHLIPQTLAAKSLLYTDERGQNRRRPLTEAHDALEGALEDRLWRLPTPKAFAPSNTLRAASKEVRELNLWFHPATRLSEGRATHRPLHAKLLTVTYRLGNRRETLVLLGSPNMSRRALLLRAGSGMGNVELAVAFKLEGVRRLFDLVPELVYAPAALVDALAERVFPELGPNWATAIDEALHDPATRTLCVRFGDEAAQLPAWRLSYDTRELELGQGRPRDQLSFTDFDLRQSTAELVLHVEGKDYSIPILITDLVALPAGPEVGGLGLQELLMLLGRRVGAERALQIAEARQLSSPSAEADELAAFFGSSFSPTDVFRAWWAVADDLSDPELSVHSFRVVLEGPMSVSAAWRAIMEAAVHSDQLEPGAAWFFGAELLRSLRTIVLPPDVDREPKQSLIAMFTAQVTSDLQRLPFHSANEPWAGRVRDFFFEGRE